MWISISQMQCFTVELSLIIRSSFPSLFQRYGRYTVCSPTPPPERQIMYSLNWLAQIIETSLFKELAYMNVSIPNWSADQKPLDLSFNCDLHKNCAKNSCEAVVRSWKGRKEWWDGRQSLSSAVMGVHSSHLRMGNNKGQSKC